MSNLNNPIENYVEIRRAITKLSYKLLIDGIILTGIYLSESTAHKI